MSIDLSMFRLRKLSRLTSWQLNDPPYRKVKGDEISLQIRGLTGDSSNTWSGSSHRRFLIRNTFGQSTDFSDRQDIHLPRHCTCAPVVYQTTMTQLHACYQLSNTLSVTPRRKKGYLKDTIVTRTPLLYAISLTARYIL